MINVLLPVAGFAKRFTECGYDLPKPLLPVAGQPMIKLAIASLLAAADHTTTRLIFVVREDHIIKYDIDNALRRLFCGWTVVIVPVDHVTQGTLCSCLVARHQVDTDEPLVIYTPDVCFQTDFKIREHFLPTEHDGFLLTFKANCPDHSYVALDETAKAVRIAEKSVISNDAIVGVYGFRTGKMFLHYADQAIATNLRVNNEFYVAPIYNLIINDGRSIGIQRIDKMHVLGTPEDVAFYESHVTRYEPVTKLAVCCDHSGFMLKEQLRRTLIAIRVDFTDFGTYSERDSDHYDSLKPCVEYLLHNTQTFGIAICNTGQGFNIAANKVKGLRSVLVHDEYTAVMGRRHNAANFFCLAARSVQAADLPKLITAILDSSFDGGRHTTRIGKIHNDPLFTA